MKQRPPAHASNDRSVAFGDVLRGEMKAILGVNLPGLEALADDGGLPDEKEARYEQGLAAQVAPMDDSVTNTFDPSTFYPPFRRPGGGFPIY